MSVLREEGKVSVTKIYVLNPKYIKLHARAAAIGRVSWLDDFYDGLLFIVLDRDIGNANGFLAAVPLHATTGGEARGRRLGAALDEVMSQVEAWTSEMYAAFSRAVADHQESLKK